jgi:hypothetical protein
MCRHADSDVLRLMRLSEAFGCGDGTLGRVIVQTRTTITLPRVITASAPPPVKKEASHVDTTSDCASRCMSPIHSEFKCKY